MWAESVDLFPTSQYTCSLRSHPMNADRGMLLLLEVDSTITSSSDATVPWKWSRNDGEQSIALQVQIYNEKSLILFKLSFLSFHWLNCTRLFFNVTWRMKLFSGVKSILAYFSASFNDTSAGLGEANRTKSAGHTPIISLLFISQWHLFAASRNLYPKTDLNSWPVKRTSSGCTLSLHPMLPIFPKWRLCSLLSVYSFPRVLV